MNEHELYTTIVGLNNYEGNKVFKVGSIVKLLKEPDNDYDLEAIVCEVKYKGTMSSGRIYDKIDKISFCEVKFISQNSVIAKILSKNEIEKLLKENPNDEFYHNINEIEE